MVRFFPDEVRTRRDVLCVYMHRAFTQRKSPSTPNTPLYCAFWCLCKQKQRKGIWRPKGIQNTKKGRVKSRYSWRPTRCDGDWKFFYFIFVCVCMRKRDQNPGCIVSCRPEAPEAPVNFVSNLAWVVNWCSTGLQLSSSHQEHPCIWLEDEAQCIVSL